jgi:thiamine biosynthesis protein ThiS
MKVVLNGTERMIEPPGTLAALLAVHHLRPMMVVVERNGEIVPRDRFDTEPVEENDHLEIVQMMAGG